MQSAAKFLVTPVSKSNSVFDFLADIIAGGNGMDEIYKFIH